METKLTAILSAKVDAFISGINQAATRLQKFGQDAEKIGTGLSLAVSAPLALIGKKAIESAGDFDALRRGLATVEKNAETLQKRLTTLAEIAKAPGLGLKETFKTGLSLRTTLGPLVGYEKAVNLATRAIVAFGNANASVGGGKADFGESMRQLQQIVSQGKLQGDELNVLASRIPQVRTAILSAFGTANTEMINAKNNAAQIVEKITAELEKLPKASGGIKNAFENLSDFMDIALDRIGTNIAKNFDLNAIIGAITGAIDVVLTKFESLSPVAQKVIIGIGAIATIIPPVIAAIGLIAPALSAGIGVVGALISPLGAVALAAGVAATAIIAHWDRVKADLVESGAWETLSRIASAALSGLASIFGVFANLVQGDWETFWIHLKNVVYSAASVIIQVAGDMLIEILSLVQKVSLIKFPSIELAKAGIRGLQEEADKAVIPITNVKKAAESLFDGFNFGGTPKKIKLGPTQEETEAAKKALDVYIKSQSEASKSIIDSLIRTRDISISLIKDETERKREELKAQAANRRAQVNVEVQSEAQRAKEILAINAKLKQDLSALDAINPLKSTAAGISTFQAFNNAGLKPMGNPSVAQKDLIGKTSSLPGLDNILDKLEKFNEKFRQKADVSLQLAKQLGGALSGALQDMAVGVAESFAQVAAGTGGLEGFARNLLSLLGSVITNLGKASIAAGIAAMSLKAVFATPAAAIAAGAAAVLVGGLVSAAASNVQGKFSGPRLAKGGEAFGPTIAMVGDNPNAYIDRELIGPTSTFRKMVREELSGYAGVGTQTVRVIGEIRGDKIALASERGNNERQTLRGK